MVLVEGGWQGSWKTLLSSRLLIALTKSTSTKQRDSVVLEKVDSPSGSSSPKIMNVIGVRFGTPKNDRFRLCSFHAFMMEKKIFWIERKITKAESCLSFGILLHYKLKCCEPMGRQLCIKAESCCFCFCVMLHCKRLCLEPTCVVTVLSNPNVIGFVFFSWLGPLTQSISFSSYFILFLLIPFCYCIPTLVCFI